MIVLNFDFDFASFSFASLEIDKATMSICFVSSPFERIFPGMRIVSPWETFFSISNKFNEDCFLVGPARIFAVDSHAGFFRARAIVSLSSGFVFFLR